MSERSDRELFKTIGKNIKYYRLLYNLNNEKLTQEKLAEMIGVSTAMIGGIESDKVTQGMSIPTLYKISKVLNVSLDDLIKERN